MKLRDIAFDVTVFSIVGFLSWWSSSRLYIYEAGLHGKDPLRAVMIHLVIFGLAVSGIVALLLHLLLRWREQNGWVLGCRLCLIVLASAGLWQGWNRFSQPEPSFISGVCDRMRKEADVACIRQWYDTQRLSGDVLVSEPWPSCIAKLRPLYVRTLQDSDGVRIGLGSGLGHWGLVVGSVDMKIPPSNSFTTIVPCQPGLYIWQDAQ